MHTQTARRQWARDYLQRYEHDACGLVAFIQRDGRPSRQSLGMALDALSEIGHRAGEVAGEGDGCGVQTDLPRRLWARRLATAGDRGAAAAASEPGFWVGHFCIGGGGRLDAAGCAETVQGLRRLLAEQGHKVLWSGAGLVNSSVLGPRASEDEPWFWQVAGRSPAGAAAGEAALFDAALAIEATLPVHVVSLSRHVAVYKVRGSAETLRAYHGDLSDPDFATVACIGHTRYSTNTTTAFARVQPFSLLGHNGEINTIARLREQARMQGIPLVEGGSDSQDLNRTIEGLMHHCGLSLPEAMEMVLPPVIGEIKHLPVHLQDLYMYFRQTWGPFAQGPAALVVRQGAELVASVDAMGLRPLWQIETETAHVLSSEPGVVAIGAMTAEPRPLAPGEKVGFMLEHRPVRPVPYPELQELVAERTRAKMPYPTGYRQFLAFGVPAGGEATSDAVEPPPLEAAVVAERERLLSAWAWSSEDVQMLHETARTGAEPIGGLGYDGPLAALSRQRQNLPDYCKESVAVVTNPAIDREREIEHFSTRVVLGARPPVGRAEPYQRRRLELRVPVLLGGHHLSPPLPEHLYREVAQQSGTLLLADIEREYGRAGAGGTAAVFALAPIWQPPEGIGGALERMATQAVGAVLTGAQVLVIDDRAALSEDRLPVDPHLVVSAVDLALKQHPVAPGQQNLRRRVSLVLRSAALRNLHDIAVALALGADAVAPYLMFELAAASSEPTAVRAAVENLLAGLIKGLEKVISTLGIHELRGYSRLVSSVGLAPEVARFCGIENFCGSDRGGLSLARLEADSSERYRQALSGERAALVRPFRLYPRIWKAAADLAGGQLPYADFAARLAALEAEHPVALRHTLDLRFSPAPLDPAAVDLSTGIHSAPFVISAMSFGSQSETAFRAYAEAARRLNIIAMNGEGGEIRDLIGRYPLWRGQQVASGRFGVQAELLNSCYLIEVKIGQGAKPGEGGHLPAAKVTAKVAAARSLRPGIDLISPSNNHDIYSIEDLAQIVAELKTANPQARVAVKVPVVPGIGTIAVGVAKSGADIITVSGYDGGTGAARRHAIRHAGLPVEIGVKEAHMALVAAGVRDLVEIWADGGLKSALDVVKLLCLGANRVGFGTLAMVAIGCTACRGCSLGTCHVGITTQIEGVEEARQRGLKRFVPREREQAVQRLVTLFSAFADEVRRLTAALGAAQTQDLVGRADLLVQARELDRIDLSELTVPEPAWVPGAPPAFADLLALAGRDDVAAYTAGARLSVDRYEGVTAASRFIGTYLAGALTRGRLAGRHSGQISRLHLSGSVPGGGLGAFNTAGMEIRVDGSAQDGVGKGGFGGKVVVLKYPGAGGRRVGGSVGKSFAYGAIAGLYLVQGDADARACIRLSGADVVIGGRLRAPLADQRGNLAVGANCKGFAFEYMTLGRAVVLGDPGPWICSGMTGGVVYLRRDPDRGLDEAALQRRIAKGAQVRLSPVGPAGVADLTELLGAYSAELRSSGQAEEAAWVESLLREPERHFVAVTPERA